MTASWPAHLFSFLAAVALVVGLFYLQIADAPKDLVYCLPNYLLIAGGALLAFASARSTSGIDVLCAGTAGVFFGYVIVRALTSPAPYHARTDLYCGLAALVVYGLLLLVFTTGRSRILLLGALLGVAVVHVTIGVVQAGLGENYSLLIPSLDEVGASERGSGFYVNPDHLAGLLEVLGIFGLSIACWSRLPGWARVCFGYLTALCYFGLILTGSRGGYISAATSLIVFGALSVIALRSAGSGVLVKFGGVGLLVIAAFVAASWMFIQQTAPLKKRVDKLLLDEGRVDLWQAALEQWKLQPLTGTGSGTYLFYGREFRPERMQADLVDVHNDYLHLLAEYGVIGAAGFLLFLVAHLRKGLQTYARFGPKRLAAGAIPLSDRLALNIAGLSAIGAYMVHSAVDFNLHIPANALLLAIVFGLIAHPGADRAPASSWRARALIPKLAFAGLSLFLVVQSARLIPGERSAEEARAALRDEDPAKALASARSALQREQQNPLIHFYIGRALIALAAEPEHASERSALFEQAIAAFERAHQLVPLDGTYPLEIAHAYDRLGRFSDAEPWYAIARARDPHSNHVAAMYANHLAAWDTARQKEGAEPVQRRDSPPP